MLTVTWAGDGLYSASVNTASTTLNFCANGQCRSRSGKHFTCTQSLNGVSDDECRAVFLGALCTRASGPVTGFAEAGAVQTTATFSAAGMSETDCRRPRLASSDDITVTVNLVEVGSAQYFNDAVLEFCR